MFIFDINHLEIVGKLVGTPGMFGKLNITMDSGDKVGIWSGEIKIGNTVLLSRRLLGITYGKKTIDIDYTHGDLHLASELFQKSYKNESVIIDYNINVFGFFFNDNIKSSKSVPVLP